MAGMTIATIQADLQLDSGNMERGLANARTALTTIESEIKRIRAEADKGLMSKPEAQARIRELAKAYADLKASVQGAYASMGTGSGAAAQATTALNAAMNGGVNSSRNLGMALMQVGAICDDLQYGLSGCVNNIAPLVQGLTGSMGLAAAAQVAAVAAFQLWKHWDQIREAFGQPALGRAIEELKTFTTYVDEAKGKALELEAASKQVKARDEILSTRPEHEEKAASETKKTLQEADEAKVAAGLMMTMRPVELGAAEKEAIEKQVRKEVSTSTWTNLQLADSEEHMDKGPREEMAAKRAELTKNYLEGKQRIAATNLIDAAQGTGTNAATARAEIAKHAEDNPNLFGGRVESIKLAKRLRESTPDAIKQREEEEVGDEWTKEMDAMQLEEVKKKRAKRLEREKHDEDMREQVKSSYESRASEFAGRFDQGNIRKKMLEGKDASGDISNMLTASGVGPNTAKKLLPLILQEMKTSMDAQAEKEMAKGHGKTKEQAKAFIAETEERSKNKTLREGQEHIDDAKTSLRRSGYHLQDLKEEHNKPKFAGYEEYSKKLALGGFDTEHYQRKLFEATEDIKVNIRKVADATQNLDDIKSKLGNAP